MKKIIAFILAVCMLGVTALAQTTIEIGVDLTKVRVADGKISDTSIKTAPYIVNGRTMIELNDLADVMKVKVTKGENEVTVEKDDVVLKFVIGENKVFVNGAACDIDEGAKQDGDAVMVPLRFVAEKLGYRVDYITTLNKIIITDKPGIMTVNNDTISVEEFDLYYKLVGGDMSAYGPDVAAIYKQIVINNVITELAQISVMENEARTIGLGNILFDDEVKQTIKAQADDYADKDKTVLQSVAGMALENVQIANAYYDMLVLAMTPTDETVKSAYESEYMAAKHILVMGDDALEKAQKIKAEIDAGADFDKLMNENSEDTGLASYPDGYTFKKGEMVDEFYEATANLKENEVSEPVKSQYGYHIIKRGALGEISKSDLETMRSNMAQNDAFEYIEKIIGNSKVEINEEILNTYR